MELVILQYFMIAQTLSVLLSDAVLGCSRKIRRATLHAETDSKLSPTDLNKPREKPCRNAGD